MEDWARLPSCVHAGEYQEGHPEGPIPHATMAVAHGGETPAP